MSATRYAIYYVPPKDSALAAFGRGWLGYDVETGAKPPQPAIAGLDLEEITDEPRRYGFHATLKAPFRLRDGAQEGDVLEIAIRLGARMGAAAGPRLTLAAIAGFLALVPDEPAPEIAALADACVREFDPLRRPPDAAERARRESAGLTARQRELLAGWGYPYVFEEFRFHMTLTRRLGEAERSRISAALAARAAAVEETLSIGDLALCRQEAGGAFRLWRRVSLGA